MGYRFSLVLSREITDEESEILKNAGCGAAIFATDSLPTNADVTVTKMDFDDTISPSLAEAIESALEAVKNVPDLSVPGLTVPAQPAGPVTEEPEKVLEGVVVEDVTTKTDDVTIEEAPAVKAEKKTTARKTTARKTTTKKAAPEAADEAMDPAGVGAASS